MTRPDCPTIRPDWHTVLRDCPTRPLGFLAIRPQCPVIRLRCPVIRLWWPVTCFGGDR